MKKIIFSAGIAFLAVSGLAGCSADRDSNVVNVEEYLSQFQNDTQTTPGGDVNGNNNGNNNGAQGNGNDNGNDNGAQGNGSNVDPVQSTFQQYLITTFDNNRNGVLDANEIASIVTLDVSGKGYTNLDGLEKLTFLESLDASNNKLTSFVVPSTLTVLFSLKVSGNQLTKLDISRAGAMTGGYSSLNATNNANLICIKLSSDQINTATNFRNKWLKDASANFNTTCD